MCSLGVVQVQVHGASHRHHTYNAPIMVCHARHTQHMHIALRTKADEKADQSAHEAAHHIALKTAYRMGHHPHGSHIGQLSSMA